VNAMNLITTTSLLSARRVHCRSTQKQRGVVAIEFALVFLFGMLPLLLLMLAGVMIFAVKQSLTLAATDGARAALHYGTGAPNGNLPDACTTALKDMIWLFGPNPPKDCGTASSISNNDATAQITAVTDKCPSAKETTCVTVTTTYNYNESPLILGTGSLYGWLLKAPLQSIAVIQVYNTQGS